MCASAGCITQLSAYNASEFCFVHRWGAEAGINRLLEVVRTGEWEMQAACFKRAWPTRSFFVDQGSRRGKGFDLATLALKKLCYSCPVKTECLTEAVRFEQSPIGYITRGIWGGMTDAERHSRTLRHIEGCVPSKTKARCRGCRPVEEVVAILHERLLVQMHTYRLLTEEEEVA